MPYIAILHVCLFSSATFTRISSPYSQLYQIISYILCCVTIRGVFYEVSESELCIILTPHSALL